MAPVPYGGRAIRHRAARRVYSGAMSHLKGCGCAVMALGASVVLGGFLGAGVGDGRGDGGALVVFLVGLMVFGVGMFVWGVGDHNEP
jgi:hypothetical protein